MKQAEHTNYSILKTIFPWSILQVTRCSGKFPRMKLFVTLIGLIFIFEGLPYVASPEGMQRWLKQLLEMRPERLRFMGILSMGFGLFLCYIAQKTGLLG